MMATTGDATSATRGTARASPTSRSRAWRGTFTIGDESSTTGSRDRAGMDHSETISAWAISAATVAISSGAAKAITAIRRSAGAGHRLSATAAADGRAATTAMRTGTAI